MISILLSIISFIFCLIGLFSEHKGKKHKIISVLDDFVDAAGTEGKSESRKSSVGKAAIYVMVVSFLFMIFTTMVAFVRLLSK